MKVIMFLGVLPFLCTEAGAVDDLESIAANPGSATAHVVLRVTYVVHPWPSYFVDEATRELSYDWEVRSFEKTVGGEPGVRYCVGRLLSVSGTILNSSGEREEEEEEKSIGALRSAIENGVAMAGVAVDPRGRTRRIPLKPREGLSMFVMSHLGRVIRLAFPLLPPEGEALQENAVWEYDPAKGSGIWIMDLQTLVCESIRVWTSGRLEVILSGTRKTGRGDGWLETERRFELAGPPLSVRKASEVKVVTGVPPGEGWKQWSSIEVTSGAIPVRPEEPDLEESESLDRGD